MKVYTDTIEFNTNAKRLFDILTKQHLHALVTDAEVELPSNVGESFNLFGGAIVGSILELEDNRKIKWSWECYVNGWESGHESQVEILIDQIDDTTTHLTINHTEIPDDAYELVVDGWKERYWDSIERFLNK